MIDLPGRRRSHQQPTPRGGGVAIVFGWLFGLLALSIYQLEIWPFLIASLPGVLLVTAIGWVDDRQPVLPVVRLAVQSLAAAWFVYASGVPEVLALGPLEMTWGWLNALLCALFLVWIVNLYNFMDGIDWLAGTEALFCGSLLALLLWRNGGIADAVPALTLATATLGFLPWNRTPAKVFMGDGGSGGVGFIIGSIILFGSHEGTISLWTGALVISLFFFDATFTLLRRMFFVRGWYNAHREHLYQLVARKTGSHLGVVVKYMTVNLIVVAPLALWSSHRPDISFYLFALAAVVAWLIWAIARGAIVKRRRAGE